MKNIVIIGMAVIGLSSAVWAEFSRSEAGVVRDSVTGLEWQDDYSESIKSATWADAISYCEALALDGGNWRLPNLNELTSLVDDTRYNPVIDPAFRRVTSSNYWSSTSVASGTSNAWHVYFYRGSQATYSKSSSYYVRCVRSGQ